MINQGVSELEKAVDEFAKHLTAEEYSHLNKYFNKIWYPEMHHNIFERDYLSVVGPFIKNYENKTNEKITINQFEEALKNTHREIVCPECPYDD
jgi:hypothetical protein